MNSVWIIGGSLFLFALWMAGTDWRWLAAGSVALVGWTFNSMVSARNQVDNAFSSVSVMLKKRYDLIPNLVDSVQRYMEHEAQVLQEVTRLRAEAMSGRLSSEQAVAVENQLGRALNQLFATAEGYPELKASRGFQDLQRSLNEVEEQISAARRSYNMSVKHYNDSVRMFPTNLFAMALGFDERSYFELPDGHGSTPEVMARFRSQQRS
jgi:LemA protein